MDFVELILAIHERFDAAEVRHAFGGALALGYVATPRGTVDIDVNVFLPPNELERVVSALAPLGLVPEAASDGAPIAGTRFTHATDPFPVDVFPSLDAQYEEISERVVHYSFGRGDNLLPFLSAEDLCIFKLSFSRPQDWVDLAAIARAKPELDIDYVERQVIGLRGTTMYPRIARLRGLLH